MSAAKIELTRKPSMKKISLYIILALIAAISVAIWHRAERQVHFTPESNSVIVGINSEFPPFSFKDDNDFTGFDIDVIKEVFKRLKKDIIFKDMPFDALIPEIQIGNIQVIAAGITPTDERAKRADFTRPHLTGNPLIIISLKTPDTEQALTTLDDLRGKKVVVNEGYIADSFMSDQPVDLLRISSALVGDAMLTLQSGRVDAFVTALHSMKPYFKKYNINDFNVTPIPNTEETSSFAVSKHYPNLYTAIQVMLNEMEQDGTLAALKAKWDLI
jgi:polar amino acid transport system substrate-binding protein